MTTSLLYTVEAIAFNFSDPDVTHVMVQLEPTDPDHSALKGWRYAGFSSGFSAAEILVGMENEDFPPYHEWSNRPHNA